MCVPYVSCLPNTVDTVYPAPHIYNTPSPQFLPDHSTHYSPCKHVPS